jgi:hypothetical protein
MLVDRFLYLLFDMHVPEYSVNEFMQNGELDESKILESPVLALNIVFGLTWKYIFKTYHPPSAFSNIVIKHTLNDPKEKPISINIIIDDMIQNLFILKAGLITKMNIMELNKYVLECINNVKSKAYIRSEVIKKMEYKLNIATIDPDSSLLYTYFKHVSDNKDYITTPPASLDDSNQFTGFKLDFDVTSNISRNNRFDMVSSILYSDNYFLIKLMVSPIIILDIDLDTSPFKEHVYQIIKYITACHDKRCMVFIRNMQEKHTHLYTQLYSQHIAYIHSDLHFLLPRISPWCLVISDAIDSRIHGLAMKDEHNILLTSSTHVVYPPPWANRLVKHDDDGMLAYKLWNTQEFWRYHTKYICPRMSNHAINNNLLYIDFVYRYYDKHKEAIEILRTSPPRTSKYIIMTVDNRENELTLLSLKFALLNTNGWKMKVYTSSKASHYYTKELPHADVVCHPLLESKFDIDIYNDILEDHDTWKDLAAAGYEYALIVQDDGTIVRPGIEAFLEYDYVGAPWVDNPENAYIKAKVNTSLVGNGGMSLRNIKKMVEVCKTCEHSKHTLFYHNINRIPEDVFFVKHLVKAGANLPDAGTASKFSIEQIVNPQTIGYHKFWAYHPYQVVQNMFKTWLAAKFHFRIAPS